MWHQEIVGRLLVALRSYLAREPVAHAFSSPSDISWGEDTLVQPDVFVLPLDQARTLDWAQAKTLLLAIEVLSPSSLRADHVIKRRLYQEHGVPEYWVVDADRKIVDIWTPRAFFPRSEKHQLVWHPSAARSPLTIPLNDLFQPI
jgi:Uma2 family endonuclease